LLLHDLAANWFPSTNNNDHYVDRMNGVIVIAAYRPKPGKEEELLDLVRNRVPILRKEGLVTDRTPTIMRASEGTIIEISEWKSQETTGRIHTQRRIPPTSRPASCQKNRDRSILGRRASPADGAAPDRRALLQIARRFCSYKIA